MLAAFLATLIKVTIEWNGQCGVSYDFTTQNPSRQDVQWSRMYPVAKPHPQGCAFTQNLQIPNTARFIWVRACDKGRCSPTAAVSLP